jgi:hypothetical protein
VFLFICFISNTGVIEGEIKVGEVVAKLAGLLWIES